MNRAPPEDAGENLTLISSSKNFFERRRRRRKKRPIHRNYHHGNFVTRV
jgi:hypothetical protein